MDDIGLQAIKKPNIKTGFTNQQMIEVVKCTTDYMHFMSNYVKVQHPILGDVQFKPYPYQVEMLKGFHENRFSIALTARQMGKTTCAGSYLLWRAMFVPNTKILIVANNFQGALEIMDRVRYSYETTPDFLRAGVKEYNKGQITFDNGSRITSRASGPNAARGLAITLLYCDEFAFLSPLLGKQFWTSVYPTLSTGGSCIITSTPKSDADQFAEIWRGAIDQRDIYGNPTMEGVGKNNFKPIKVTFDKHPDRGPGSGFEEESRATLGDAKFRQEHCCEFVTDDLTLIDPEFLLQMRSKPSTSWLNEIGTPTMVRFFKDIEPNRAYMVGLDPSLGTGGDPAAIQVFELPSMIQVAEWSHRRVPLREQVGVLKDILHQIDDELQSFSSQRGESQIYWTVENNSMGAASVTIINDTGEDKFPGMFVSEKRKRGQRRLGLKGMTTTAPAKRAACVRFKSLVETGRLKINSEDLIRELKFFVTTLNSAKAKPGETDDLVTSALLCIRMLDQIATWEDGFEGLQEMIYDEMDDIHEAQAMVF